MIESLTWAEGLAACEAVTDIRIAGLTDPMDAYTRGLDDGFDEMLIETGEPTAAEREAWETRRAALIVCACCDREWSGVRIAYEEGLAHATDLPDLDDDEVYERVG